MNFSTSPVGNQSAAASTAALDAQLRTEGLLKPELFPPYRGDSFELVQLGTTPIENGNAVRAAYERAKSATGAFALFVPPADVDFGSTGLIVDDASISISCAFPGARVQYLATGLPATNAGVFDVTIPEGTFFNLSGAVISGPSVASGVAENKSAGIMLRAGSGLRLVNVIGSAGVVAVSSPVADGILCFVSGIPYGEIISSSSRVLDFALAGEGTLRINGAAEGSYAEAANGGLLMFTGLPAATLGDFVARHATYASTQGLPAGFVDQGSFEV